MCHRCNSQKCHSDKKKEEGCTSKGIKQCYFDKNKGVYVINKAGNYHLTKDVKGTISIQAHNVCLDLCCHTLDANGADNAIVIGQALVEQATVSAKKTKSVESLRSEISSFKKKSLGEAQEKPVQKAVKKSSAEARDVKSKTEVVGSVHHIRISNGTVCGAADAAILVNSVFDLEVSDLTMLNNALDSIRILYSNVVAVKNVEFSGLESGERALLVNYSDNLTVSNCSASGYLSTIGAILEFNTSNTIDMSNVSVTNNAKSSIEGNVIWDSSTALVFFGGFGIVNYDPYVGCYGVRLDNVRVNNNIIDNSNDSRYEWQTFEAIFLGYCNNCSISNCETSNNADIAGSVGADTDTEDFMLNLMFCDGCTITNHKANNNESAPLVYYSAIACLDSTNIVLEGCQSNSNVVYELITGGFPALFVVYWLNAYFGPRSETVIRHCEANDNVLISGGEGRTSWNGDSALFTCFQAGGDDSIVDHCSAINNSIGDYFPFTLINGIVQDFADNVTISNCVTNSNRGGELSFGIGIITTRDLGNTVVSNCIANDNGNAGINVGYTGFERPIQNIVIEHCKCIGNGHQPGPSAGISLGTLGGAVRDAIVQNCKVINTGGLLSTSTGYGIISVNPDNVIIKDCDVVSEPELSSIGVSLIGGNNCKILNTEVLGQADEGFVLDSDTSNSLVQDCHALGNGGVGFVDNSAFANAWLGNKAQNNTGGAYSGVAVGNISTYDKATGLYTTTPYSTTNLNVV